MAVKTHTTYQMRASLTRGKHRRLDAAFAVCARLYNAALENWRSAYKTTSYWRGRENAVSPTMFDQMKELAGVRADDPTYASLSVEVERGVLRRLDRARKGFYSRVKKGDDKPGFPKHKSSRRWNSIEVAQPSSAMVKPNGRGGYAVKVKGLPTLKIKPKRELPNSTLKSIVIKRTPRGVYVSLTYEIQTEPLPKTGRSVGIDMGVITRFALSDGTNYPRARRADLSELQRRVSRCKSGSNRRRKLNAQLARASHRDAVRRRNETHRITTEIVRSHDFIAIEDLKPKNMTKSASGSVEEPGRGVSQKRGLNRSIQEQAWGVARTQFEYKSLRHGRGIEAANPRYTSQACSVCDAVDASHRRGKLYECGRCGATLDADTNASRVILIRGLEIHYHKSRAGNLPRG